jgi:hypothetical protein
MSTDEDSQNSDISYGSFDETKGIEKSPGGTKKIVKIRAAKNASATQQQTNSLKQNEKLKSYLENVDEIQTVEHFTYWRDEFLMNFREFVDPEGTANAREADDHLYFQLQKLAIKVVEMEEMCEKGHISEKRSTVKGQNALNEVVSLLAKLEKEIENFLPKKAEDEKKAGYTKMELGAVLIRDGFRIYGFMVTTRDVIVRCRDQYLKGILKPNQLSILQFYLRSIDTFCDTLADVGLYKLMNKCNEIYSIRPRKRKKQPFKRDEHDALSASENSDGEQVEEKMFQAAKGEFKSVMDKGWVNAFTGAEEKDLNAGKEGDLERKMKIRPKSRRESAKKEEEEEQDTEMEWIYYFDPDTGNIGKISRVQCELAGAIVSKDKKGKEAIDGAEKDVARIRELITLMKDACKPGKTTTKKGRKSVAPTQ